MKILNLPKVALGIMLFNLVILGVLFYLLKGDYDVQKSPASDYVTIDYIKASDVVNGEQSFVMCRWVDTERASKWTWEMTNNSSDERVFSHLSGAIMETKDDCLVTWTTSDPYANRVYENGTYHWNVIVNFQVEGYTKILTARSNDFEIISNKQ